ncbi:hypothetical protein Leryth_009252 [Lithospermum erythrorhizon]|nr:hypothetical protein Leryth_009252 [Lithospermum erythrorhizon]
MLFQELLLKGERPFSNTNMTLLTIMDKEKKKERRRNILVGISFDEHSKELINWAIEEVASPGDNVIAVHVCRKSDTCSKRRHSLDSFLVDYKGLCNKKQVTLEGETLKGCSINKVLVKAAKTFDAVAVIVGISKHYAIGGCLSAAKYCAKCLPTTTEVVAIHQGKIVFSSNSKIQLPISGNKVSFHSFSESSTTTSEFADSETTEIGTFSQGSTPRLKDEDEQASLIEEHKGCSLRLISLPVEDFTKQKPGWPLLRTASLMSQPSLEAKSMSVVQWAMGLPNRTISSLETSGELVKDLDRPLRINSADCTRFTHQILSTSTSDFSPANLIGRGGWNRVYKGILPQGKPVAVKVMNSSKERWDSFSQEVDIMTTLKHQSIAPLLGICAEEKQLISVYDFFSKGNLGENLHGDSADVLPWNVKFNIAIRIAEALNYLHNECPSPIIHRDVKSSNILLTQNFEPKLSDFGLAIHGPTKAEFLTECDVVGTFGYLAPEYFMYGKVSDKIDVYAFGVVLLELLSGRNPIGSQSPKVHESLVIWAKPKLVDGDIESILDPKLKNMMDKDQTQRLFLAAKLCLTQSARLRPTMNQVLKVLRGEATLLVELTREVELNQQDNDDDEVYPDSNAEPHLNVALLDISTDDSSISLSSPDQRSPLSVEEYFKRRCRSSSLD